MTFDVYKNKASIIKNEGIFFWKNFLLKEETAQVLGAIKKFLSKKQDPKGYFLTNNIQIFKNLIKFNFSKVFSSNLLLNISQNKKMLEIADCFFEKKSVLKKIDCYFTPINNNDNLEWHNDLAPQPGYPDIKNFSNYGNRYLKFFIYLTKVSPDNGCTSFIPKSHKIIYAICDGLAKKEVDYKPFFSLEDVRNFLIVNKNYQYIKKYFSDDLIDNFLEKTNFKNKNNCKNFDFSMDPGDAIVFDEAGIHRASKTTSERIVLRYLFGVK